MSMKLPRLFATLLFALLLPFAALAGDTVDINSADAKTLSSALSGIGEKKANAIVEYRKKNGPFKSADDLTKVDGIGPKTLEKNRDKIVVSSGSSSTSDKSAKDDKESDKEEDKEDKEDKDDGDEKDDTKDDSQKDDPSDQENKSDKSK